MWIPSHYVLAVLLALAWSDVSLAGPPSSGSATTASEVDVEFEMLEELVSRAAQKPTQLRGPPLVLWSVQQQVPIISAGLSFARGRPTDPRRWDAIAHAFAAAGTYAMQRKAFAEDGQWKETPAERTQYADWPRVASTIQYHELFARVAALLASPETPSDTYAYAVSTMLDWRLQNDPLSFENLRQAVWREPRTWRDTKPDEFPAIMEKPPMHLLVADAQWASKLFRSIEGRAQSGEGADTPQRGQIPSVEMSYQAAFTSVRRMLRTVYKDGPTYRDELMRVSSGPFESAARYAKEHLRRLGEKGPRVHFRMTSLDNEPIESESLLGRVVLLHFWSVTCAACREQIRDIRSLHEKYARFGLQVVGISLDEEADRSGFAQAKSSLRISWPQTFDGAGWRNTVAHGHGVSGMPSVFLLAKDGTLASTRTRQQALELEIVKQLGLPSP